MDNEDPHAHIRSFIFLSNTCKLAGVDQDKIRRLIFPFSLRDKVITWYMMSGSYSIVTFDELIQEFINKFFPPSKIEDLCREVHQFQKQDKESFKDA